MDPNVTFMQTLIGLACYAQGLRDKGIKLLNNFGITTSVFHIRQHGSWWAKIRNAIKEISSHAFWHVTFDNLDFRMKFAKKLSSGGGQLKRMFHLLTSQVSFRKNSTHPFNSNHHGIATKDLTENHFKLDYDKTEWEKFSKSTFKVICDENESSSNSQTGPSLLTKLQQHMPHWTPTCSDKIVYTTVDEAHSGSADDVGSFLVKVKKDLCIGVSGYPKYVIVGGDQQTYSIMKNLKVKYGDHYDWLYPVPGDWHIMKTAAEVVKYVLSDGGFKVFAAKCGHKGDITQWQDIHNVLTACHEALVKAAVEEYKKGDASRDFWVWVESLTGDSNNDVTRFWSQMLIYLHAYADFTFPLDQATGCFVHHA